MKKYILKISILITLIISSNMIMAQPGFDDDVNDVPVDGGIAILLVAGLSYGAKRIHNIRNK
jgi:hypothetical protein